MSRSVNKVILVGTVGRDPDIQTVAGGKVAHLSLATTRPMLFPEGPERTDWHRITLTNRLAQFAEDYIRVGHRIYVDGLLEYGSYERDGVCIPTAEITVKELVLLDPTLPPSPEEVR